jgi:hypothetical protein
MVVKFKVKSMEKLYTVVCKDEDNDVSQRVCFVEAYGEKEAVEKASYNPLIRWFRSRNRNTKFEVKREILNDYSQKGNSIAGKEEKKS